MQTRAIIEGLSILEKYRDNPDGYNCGAEHDMIYAYATSTPVSEDDLNGLVKLGWFQPDVEVADEFSVNDYDPEEGWACYV